MTGIYRTVLIHAWTPIRQYTRETGYPNLHKRNFNTECESLFMQIYQGTVRMGTRKLCALHDACWGRAPVGK